MHAEEFKGWVCEEMRKKEPVRRQGELVVRLVQRNFRDRNPPAELAGAKMVLIHGVHQERRRIGNPQKGKIYFPENKQSE